MQAKVQMLQDRQHKRNQLSHDGATSADTIASTFRAKNRRTQQSMLP
eukprot:SAG31_NODE_8429_length_1454_cov_1.263469_2_plen_46_part_01